MKRLLLVGLALAALTSCATVREELDVGAGKTAVYVTYRESRQDGYNQTCRDVWLDGKLIDAKCAQGPSLLQSATAGTTAGALGAYLHRPDRFEENETITNAQSQGQAQHQKGSSYSSSMATAVNNPAAPMTPVD